MESGYSIFGGHFFNQPFQAGSLFFGLSADDSNSLSRISTPLCCFKDTILVSRNHQPAVYILKKGIAESVLINEIDKQLVKHSVACEEVIGINETLANLPFQATVKTLTACSYHLITARDFLEFLESQPKVCLRIARQLGQDICRSSNTFSKTWF
jgi:CRP-like cAMP-binding protein